MAQARRYLVKMRPATGLASLRLMGAEIPLLVRPLFESIAPPSAGLGVNVSATWHIVEPALRLDTGNPWDVCHALVTQGLGFAGGPPPEFAEPDFQQSWTAEAPEDHAFGLTANRESNQQKTGACGYPGDPDNLWYQDDNHAEFEQALGALQPPSVDKLVRIAHFDTGFDPNHRSLPRGLESDLQRNFVEDKSSEDASDDSSGLFNNRGHGTGTLSILAGAPTGGL